MRKHSCTSARVAIDLAQEIATCPGATLRVIVDGKELFVTGYALEETTSLGGRQRVWTLKTEEVTE